MVSWCYISESLQTNPLALHGMIHPIRNRMPFEYLLTYYFNVTLLRIVYQIGIQLMRSKWLTGIFCFPLACSTDLDMAWLSYIVNGIMFHVWLYLFVLSMKNGLVLKSFVVILRTRPFVNDCCYWSQWTEWVDVSVCLHTNPTVKIKTT